MTWLTLLLSPEGRINRLHFWLGWLVLCGIGAVLLLIPIFGHFVFLFTLYCHVCVYSKRLHDMGRTGWWQLIPFVLGGLLIAAGVVMSGFDIFSHLHDFESSAGFWVILRSIGWILAGFSAAGFFGFIFLLWIGLSNSQPGDNRFGPPAPTTLA